MKRYVIYLPLFCAMALMLALVLLINRTTPEPIQQVADSVLELRPQGSYTLSGTYSDGMVFDETGNVWEYHADDIPGVSSETETPVIINFHGFGTPELEDDIILGLSYGLLEEAYCSESFTEQGNEQVFYQFKTLDDEYFWVLTTEELGFTPVIGDQVLMCYTENETPDFPYDDELIYTRVL